jgi:hypothetical protein
MQKQGDTGGYPIAMQKQEDKAGIHTTAGRSGGYPYNSSRDFSGYPYNSRQVAMKQFIQLRDKGGKYILTNFSAVST